MRLEKPTHIIETNELKMRMSEFTEEIPIQLRAGIRKIGDGERTYYSIYPVAPEVPNDEFPSSEEWMQTTGVAPDRLTVEIKQADAHGVHRLYTVGRPAGAAGPAAETEPIQNGDNTYMVQPTEVLTAGDALELFQHYYDTHSVPAGWRLREQPEFSDAAVEPPSDQATADSAKPSAGHAPVADSDTARGTGKPTNADQKGERRR